MSPARTAAALAVLLWAFAVAVATGSATAPAPPIAAHCAGDEPVESVLFLIGDAGAPLPAEDGGDPVAADPVLRALAVAGADAVARVGPERAAAVFLGDNVYPDGIPPEPGPDRERAERRLGAQIEALRRAGLRAWFLPGNHDWGDGDADDGRARVRRQGELLAASGIATLQPANACPGPERVRLGDHVELVLLDTAWWLHDGAAPRDPGSSCATRSEAEVTAALVAALHEIVASGRHAVVAAHHPLATGGPHGLRFRWTDHLFPLRSLDPRLVLPLPILGSAYPLARILGASPQDFSHPRNRALRRALEGAMEQAPPLVYAAGHEHGLQLLRGNAARWLVVSGAGSSRKITFVRPALGALYGEAVPGFARLDVRRNASVELRFFATPDGEPANERFSACLHE